MQSGDREALKASAENLPDVPPGLWEKIDLRLKRNRTDKKTVQIPFFKKVWVPLAAAAAILVIVYFGNIRSQNRFNAEEYLFREIDYIYSEQFSSEAAYAYNDGGGSVIDMVLNGEIYKR